MNFKAFLKTIFIIAVLVLLVLMGIYNHQMVRLTMPVWIYRKPVDAPAALMYIAFFGGGFLAGAIMMLGGGKKSGGGSSKSNKVQM